jgi:Predicted membrane protein (DUF2142)
VIPEAETEPSRLTPDRLVLALGLAGGLLLVFVTPPFQVPDEPAHFFRAYQVATGAGAEPGPGGGTVLTLLRIWFRYHGA